MTLLSPIMMWFAAAAAVPLILHLYQRRNRTVMWFSSNRFFTQTIVRSQRRLRLRRLLLLLVRMGACLLIAAAAAQPVLDRLGFTGGAGNRDVVILLDDSLSMTRRVPPTPVGGGAAEALPDAPFHRARQIALDFLHELGGGDRAAVMTFTGRNAAAGDAAAPRLTGDVARLAGRVQALRPTPAAGDPVAVLRRVADAFDSSQDRRRLVVAITDRQDSDWRKQPWPQPGQPVDLVIVPLAPPPADNLAVESMALTEGAAVLGQPGALALRLANFRDTFASADLVVRLDGRELARRKVDLPAHTTVVEHVPMTFDSAGDHRLEAMLDAADAQPLDDRGYLAVTVAADLPLLVVDGQADAGGIARRQSAAFFLRAAMLSGGGPSDQAPALRPDLIRPTELAGARLEGYRAVILCSVRSLPAGQVERLEHFTAAGGGLGVFLGEQADTEFYQRSLGDPTRPRGGLMPVTFGGIVEAGVEGPLDRTLHVLQADTEHPVLARFTGDLRSALASVCVYRAYRITPANTWTVASLEGGLPLILERAYGRGRVMLFAAPPSPAWTNLPLRRLFIPLITRTAGYLAAHGGADLRRTPVEVHQDALIARGNWDTSRPVFVQGPDGGKLTAAVRLAGAEPVAYLPANDVSLPGFYSVVADGPAAAGKADTPAAVLPPSAARILAVNVPPSESPPAVLDIAETRKLAGTWKLRMVEPTRGAEPGAPARLTLAALLAGQESGRGVWDALLWLVLLLVLLEPLIANRLRNRAATARPAAATPAPEARAA